MEDVKIGQKRQNEGNDKNGGGNDKGGSIAHPNGHFGRGNKRIFIDRKSFVFGIELFFERKGNEKEGQIALSIAINPYKICH